FDGTSVVTLGVAGASVGSVAFNNTTSGTITLSPVTGALGTVTLSLPAATDTLIGKATTDTLTNKTLDTAGTGNVLKINGTQVSAVTGTGSVVLATSPTLVTPTLGVASATTINKVTLTTPATGSTLTIADGKTLTASNTMTFAAGADGQTWTFPSSSDTVVTLGAAQTLTSKTLTTPVINGTSTGTGVSATPTASIIAMWDANKNLSANNFIDGFTTTATAGATTTLTVSSTGVQVFTGSTTQTVTLPTTSIVAGAQYVVINNSTGAVTVQSSGANTITVLAASTSAVFTAMVATPTTAANWNSQYLATVVTSGKKLSVSNTLTLAGTDATTMTFPGASDTVGGLGTAQTWTAQNKFNNIVDVNNAITASGNAATVPVTYRLSTVTNNSAATLTITMATASAVDGQMTIVRILDFSAVAQTISWVNTENSTVNAPTTSNGSTTLPLTVGFMYNAGTSKWRCIASA
ncbi:MAG: hypothetical protein KGI08_10265, partial [Thaumarchaeota archaeon]|nr:hypothetical protein [Nitrososphaerota archaeon]